MFSLAVDYFLLVFFAACGVIQLAAAHSRIGGLLFVSHVGVGYVIGLGLLAGAFAWFVAIGDQNIPGDLGGVEGAQQFGLFLAGAAGAVLSTMAVASMARIRTSSEAVEGTGVEALRNQTLLAVAMWRFRKWRGHDRR